MISNPNSNIFTKSMSQLWHTASQLWHHVTIVTRLEILVLKMMVRGDSSYKTKVLQISTQYVDFRGCHSVQHPHLPNYTWFWMIFMACITVTPSTSSQYGGKSQNLTFYPIIGFQYTTFHKGIDPKVKVIQCNMVNEENLWSPRVIQSRWSELFHFTPKTGWMARIWEPHRPKIRNALALKW